MWNNLKSRVAFLCIAGIVVIVCSLIGAGVAQYVTLLPHQSQQAMTTTQNVQKFFLMERAQQLENAANIVARNPSFAGYVAHAFGDDSTVGGVDTASIRDLIGERREDLQADVVAIFTVDGKLVAASGENMSDSLNLSRNPILDRAKKTTDSVSGFLIQDHRVLLVTCTSLRRGADLQAILLTGQKIDTNVITQAARLTNAGLVLLQQSGTAWQVVTSSVDERVAQTLPAIVQHMSESDAGGDKVDIAGDVWIARATPLNSNDASIVLVSLLPPSFSAGIMQALGLPLLAVAVVWLILLFVLGFVLWSRMAKPLSHLAILSDRATKGDHALEFNMAGGGVVGRIGAGFNYLTHQLSRHRVPTGTPLRRATDRRAS